MQRANCVPLSFNTQPPEGGWITTVPPSTRLVRFQHTAARRRLDNLINKFGMSYLFQHTAARRRLDDGVVCYQITFDVSTHSRPKAAGHAQTAKPADDGGFNTQPPEGGWSSALVGPYGLSGFQHTAARRRLEVAIHIPSVPK